MTDYLSKTLVESYDWSDFNEPRKHVSREIINGRVWFKTGRYCSTALVGDVYKLNNVPSEEPFKYVLLVGVSRQHPNERQGTRQDGVEVAALNAKTDPIMMIKLMNVPVYSDFKKICESYVNSIPYQFIRTRQESEELEDSEYWDDEDEFWSVTGKDY